MEEVTDINKCHNIDILRKEAVRLRTIVDTINIQRKKYRRDYYIKNTDKIKSYNKKYYLNNPEKVAANRKRWLDNNKEYHKAKQKEWYLNNKEHLKEYQREYRAKHSTKAEILS